VRGRGKRALPSVRSQLVIALLNDARWRLQTNAGRLALLVAAADYATGDLSFKVSHADWAARAKVSKKSIDRLAEDATGIELLTRSRQRRDDGMLGTYTYRFDPCLLGDMVSPGTRGHGDASSSGDMVTPQEVQVKALGKNRVVGTTGVGVTSNVDGERSGYELRDGTSSRIEDGSVENRSRASSDFLDDETRRMAEKFAAEGRRRP
jgi:hypothetical protein